MKFLYYKDDGFVGQRIALGKYEEYETKLIFRQAQDCSVAIDIGANIGYYSLLLAQRAKKVYAFEPEKNNLKILRKNLGINKIKNVEVVAAAVGDKNEKALLYKSGDNFGDHRLWGKGQTEKVDTVRLDDFIKEKKVDLIKIDTQGWEPAVIEGAKKIIERDKPIIFLEYWEEGYQKAGLDGRKMMEFLRKIYPVIWQIDDWYYVYKKTSKNIAVDRKKGYADLWMKNKVNVGDFLASYKDIQVRKVIKSLCNNWLCQK